MTQTQDEQNFQTPVESTPNLSSVDGVSETPIQKEPVSQQGVTAVKEAGRESIEQIQQIGGDIINSGKETVQETVSTAKQVGQNAIQGSIETTTQVTEKIIGNTVNATEGLIDNAMGAAGNIVQSTGSVVQNSVNNVVGATLPKESAQKVADFQNKISATAQNLGTQAKDTLQETGQKAKGFFSNLWNSFKSGFSSKEAQKVMDEANAPLETPAQPQVQQPTTEVAQPQAAQPQVEQPAAPQTQQPTTEVNPGDVQQPTNNA